MATLRWAARADEETVLSTELNSLGSGSNKITTSAMTNTDRYMYADFELSIGSQTARTGSAVNLYLLPELDGTNFSYGGDSLDPSPNHFVGAFTFDLSISARVDIIRGVLLPVGSFHVLVENNTGQAFNASGNTLTMRRYNTESV